MNFYMRGIGIPERVKRPEPTQPAIAYLGKLQFDHAEQVVETYEGLDHPYAGIGPEEWLHGQAVLDLQDVLLSGEVQTPAEVSYGDFVKYGATSIINKSDRGWQRFWEAALTNVHEDDGPGQSALAIEVFHKDMQATRDVVSLGENFMAWQKYCAAYPATRTALLARYYDGPGRTAPVIAADIVSEIKSRLSEGAYQEFKKELYSGAWARKRLPFQKRTRPMPFEKRERPTRYERVRDAVLDNIQDSSRINLDGNPYVRIPFMAAVAVAATASELVIDPVTRYHNRHADIRRVGAIRWLADDLDWPIKRFFRATPQRTWLYEHVWLGLSEKHKQQLAEPASSGDELSVLSDG